MNASTKAVLALLVVVILYPVTVLAESAEQLFASMPPDWKIANKIENETITSLSMMPVHQTFEAWEDLIELQTIRDTSLSIESVIKQIEQQYQKDCPKIKTIKLQSTTEASYPVEYLTIVCYQRGNTPYSETALVKVAKGLIQTNVSKRLWKKPSIHPDEASSNVPITSIKAGLNYLKTVILCPSESDNEICKRERNNN